MKAKFGSRPVREDTDAIETIDGGSRRNRDWSGTVGKPCRADAPVHVEGGRYIRGDRRAWSMPGQGPRNAEELAQRLFGAAGVTDGDWTWTITSTRQTFLAWRTA